MGVQIIAHNPILRTDRCSQLRHSDFHRPDLIFLTAWAEISARMLITTAVINCTYTLNLDHQSDRTRVVKAYSRGAHLHHGEREI